MPAKQPCGGLLYRSFAAAPLPLLSSSPLYSTTVSKALRQTLRGEVERTSQNSVYANFREFSLCELPRIPIPRTPVNRSVRSRSAAAQKMQIHRDFIALCPNEDCRVNQGRFHGLL